MDPVFSVKQRKCIDLLALGELTQAEIAQQIRCNPTTISKWKKHRGFMEAVVDRSRELLRESIPEVYHALSKKSKGGNSNHIRIFLDHLEKLEQVRAGRASITFTWQPPTQTGETSND